MPEQCDAREGERQQPRDRPPAAGRQAAVGEQQQRPRHEHEQADEAPVVDPRRPLAERRAGVGGLDRHRRERPQRAERAAAEQGEPEPVPGAGREHQRAQRGAGGDREPEAQQREQLVRPD